MSPAKPNGINKRSKSTEKIIFTGRVIKKTPVCIKTPSNLKINNKENRTAKMIMISIVIPYAICYMYEITKHLIQSNLKLFFH